MINLKINPKNPQVARFIDCYWYLEKTSADMSPDYPGLNPDPAGHLIIADAGQPYEYSNNLLSASGLGSHLIYPNSKTITVNHSKPFRIIGIKFQVGALYSLKIEKIQKLIDRVIAFDISSFLNTSILFVDELFLSLEDSAEAMQNLLDEYLNPVLSDVIQDKSSRIVREVLNLYPEISLSEIGSTLGCSQRTVERSFLKVTGLTLKQFYTMDKLELLLAHLYSLEDEEIRWADIAQDFGFSDQPHLVRSLKKSIDNTPGEYAKNRDLTIDAYGNFE